MPSVAPSRSRLSDCRLAPPDRPTASRQNVPLTLVERATSEAIATAGEILRAGGLVAFPTETVYGLGADATSDAAVARIYAAKRRPSFNPLIAHLDGLDAGLREGDFSPDARKLGEVFWPGPLTLIVPWAAAGTISQLARAGLDSVALRVPAHPVAHALLAAAARPVAAPSANRSGRVSPTTAGHVAHDLDGRIDMILDGGPTEVGVESTIVSCVGERAQMLRPGGLAREVIERVLGYALGRPADRRSARRQRPDQIVGPGTLTSHYAPRAKLRLNAGRVWEGEAVLDFAGTLSGSAAPAGAYRDLSPNGDLTEAAANLFAHLHALDAEGISVIAVAPIPSNGLGEAINDRLARAANRDPDLIP
ncbi:MAG: threonylcarbamoyl-AMP synthase [Methylobacteriaceae bacterium]|nr:threonylcarbamoyl-AMP synthase [Methylobacteriaceae bacterium]